MYASQLPPGPPLMAGEQMVYFSNGGSGPFVPCPPSPNPYGPPVSYGVQYPGMLQPGPPVMNCPVSFGAPSPPHWQHMGPVMPMFGMPPPRQPMPYQSVYPAPHGLAPQPMYVNGTALPPQPFRPSHFPPAQAPYMMTTYPGDEVFIVHQDVVPMGSYGYPTMPARGHIPPAQCVPPPPYNQGGVGFVNQHPPGMHGMQQQPLIQFSGMQPMGLQQQSGYLHQQPLAAGRGQYKKTEQEAMLATSRAAQSYKAQSRMTAASSQNPPATQPAEDAEFTDDLVTLPTEPIGDDNVDKSIPIPETPLEEEESFSDREIEEQPVNDSLDSDEMLDKLGRSASQTTLTMSPSSSDGSLTLCSSPVSVQISDDDISITDDNIPTKDHEYSLSASYAACQADDAARRDLDEEPKKCDKDNTSIPATVTSKKETQQCYGKIISDIPSSTDTNKERSGCNSPSTCKEDQPCCLHRKPEKVLDSKGGKTEQINTPFVHQKPYRIRSHIDRPVYHEKPSRILAAPVPHSNSPGKEQGSDNQHRHTRSYLTTHFRLLFEPIPQQPEK